MPRPSLKPTLIELYAHTEPFLDMDGLQSNPEGTGFVVWGISRYTETELVNVNLGQ